MTTNNFYNDRCIHCQRKKDTKSLSIDFSTPVKKLTPTSDSELCQLNILISARDKQQLKLYSLLQGRTLKEEVSNAIKFYIEHIEKNENP
ncbi:hypothetical protein [Clostridium sp. ETTB3]